MPASCTSFGSCVPWSLPLVLGVLLAACPGPDATPELEDPASPGAVQQPAPPADAPPTAAPPDPERPNELPQGVTAQMVQDGNRIYHQQGICFTCHGADGAGGPLGPALNDQEWIHLQAGSYEEILNVIRTGVTQPVEFPAAMPPMGGASLTDAQLRSVAAYVFAISHGVRDTPG